MYVYMEEEEYGVQPEAKDDKLKRPWVAGPDAI